MSRYLSAGLLLALLLGPSQPARSQWAVLDGSNLAQNTTTAFNTAKQVKTQADQLIAQYNLVRNTLTQIENQVKNLQRIPKGLNMFDAIGAYGNQLTGLMEKATRLSFQLDEGVKQFERLYTGVAQLTSGKDIRAARKQMLDARMETSGMAVQVQSIKGNMGDIYTRLCTLLNGSWTASGNLDSQQIKAQQDALLLHSQQQAQVMLATSQRLAAMEAAEDAVLQQLRLKSLDALSAPRTPYHGTAIELITLTW